MGPSFLQNAIVCLSLFAIAVSKKIRNRAGYYSFFSKQQSQKSNRPKPSIFKDYGYINFLVFFFCFNTPSFALKTDGSQIAHFSAKHVHVNQESGVSVFSENVAIDQGSSHLRAVEAITKTNKNHKLIEALAKGTVTSKAHFWTKPETNKPELHLYAQRIIYYPIEHRIALEGPGNQILIDQGAMHIRASKALGSLNENNQLCRAQATGDAKYPAHYWSVEEHKKPEVHAYANVITFYPEKHLIELKGNARVRQGNDSFSAAFIQYDTKTEHVISKSNGKTPTVIIIHPGKKYE